MEARRPPFSRWRGVHVLPWQPSGSNPDPSGRRVRVGDVLARHRDRGAGGLQLCAARGTDVAEHPGSQGWRLGLIACRVPRELFRFRAPAAVCSLSPVKLAHHCRAPDRSVPSPTERPRQSAAPATPPSDVGSPQTTAAVAVRAPASDRWRCRDRSPDRDLTAVLLSNSPRSLTRGRTHRLDASTRDPYTVRGDTGGTFFNSYKEQLAWRRL